MKKSENFQVRKQKKEILFTFLKWTSGTCQCFGERSQGHEQKNRNGIY